jgi:hypothetical protein
MIVAVGFFLAQYHIEFGMCIQCNNNSVGGNIKVFAVVVHMCAVGQTLPLIVGPNVFTSWQKMMGNSLYNIPTLLTF